MVDFKRPPGSGTRAGEADPADGFPGIEIIREVYPRDRDALPDAMNLIVYAMTGIVALVILRAVKRIVVGRRRAAADWDEDATGADD